MSFKRRVLSALGKDALLEIGRDLELDVTTRMGVDELRDALAKSKRAKLDAIVQESLSRDMLKDICGAVGLDDTGKEKAALVERILAAGGDTAAHGAGYRIDPAAVRGRKAAESGGALGALRSGLDAVPVKRPTKTKGKTKKDQRRRGGVPESETVIAGTLKAALQQFALGAAGGYSGADAHVAFTTHLLECFGWPNGRPHGAGIPHTFAIADAGKRVAREVALWWPERRTLLEVAGHDAGLDFAWKDLVRVCLQLDPRLEFFREELKGKRRFVVGAANSARPVFVFLSSAFVPTNTLYIFAFDDDYSYGLIQSSHHWSWAIGKGTRTREDISYGTGVWRTFPWPHDPTDQQIESVAAARRELRSVRRELMEQNDWSLRQLHQAADVEGAHPLKDAQAALDAAVADAYGMPPDQSPVEFLLELNQLVAEDEQQGRKVRGPGLPDHLDPKDLRWSSTDCIEPPPVGS